MGYERRRPPRLLFLHNGFQRLSPGKSSRPPNSLTRGGRAVDDDEVDRAASPVVVEDANRQSPRPPGERVEVGTAPVEQRAVGIVIMAVHDVQIAVAFG